MSKNYHYTRNPEISFRDEGEDGALLFNPDTNEIVVINPTGRIIWQMLETPHSLEEIAVHLTAVFQGIDTQQAIRDAEQFIQTLAEGFILETENAKR